MVKSTVFMLIISVFFSACAPSAVALKPEEKQRIKNITILKVNEPEIRMMNLGSPGMAFGAVGGAIVGAAGETDADKLKNLLDKNNFDYGDHLTNELKNQLEEMGYQSNIIEVSRKDADKLMEDYSSISDNNCDAVLDVVVQNYGYVTQHFMMSPFWRAEARVYISLADPKINKPLYQETLMYGYHNPLMSGTELDAPEKYRFDDKEQILTPTSNNAIEGLMESTSSIARHIAQQLKK